MDSLLTGVSQSKKISITYADVTQTAKTLERRHLCGPTASRILAELLAGIAVMSNNLSAEEEHISAQLLVDGPLGGALVDASISGELRGYTNIKVLNDLDGEEKPDLSKALGEKGTFSVVQATNKAVGFNGIIHIDPPTVRAAVARYFNESLQRPAAVEIFVEMKDNYIDRAVAIVAEKMPDATSEDFIPVLEKFDSQEMKKFIGGECDWEKLAKFLGFNDLVLGGVKEIKFGCTCSLEAIKEMLKTIDENELNDIINEGKGQEICCHFCGADYNVSHEELTGLKND